MCCFRTQLPYKAWAVIQFTTYFSDLSFFQLTAQGGFSENPGMVLGHLPPDHIPPVMYPPGTYSLSHY